MSALEIDVYLEGVRSPNRAVLSNLRATILRLVPDAEEVISYRIPAFKIEGAVFSGFATYKDHMSYFPFSGSVLAELSTEIAGYSHTKSALHFTSDKPLGNELVERLVAVRRMEIRTRGR